MRCVVCPVCGHFQPVSRGIGLMTTQQTAWEEVDDHIVSCHGSPEDVFPAHGVRTECPVCNMTVAIVDDCNGNRVLSRHCKPVTHAEGKDSPGPNWCEASLMTRDDADDLAWSRVPGRRPGVYTCPHHP